MQIFYADHHAHHDCAGEIKDGELKPCFENPTRADAVEKSLKEASYSWLPPTTDFGLDPILAVHEAGYITFLQTAWAHWQDAGRSGDIFPLCWPGDGMRRDVSPENIDGKIGLYAFDSGTPICAGTYDVAYQGAQCALNAAQALLDGESQSFAFSRPPGHHAMPGQYGGYCFMNNAAIAAQHLRNAGEARVAVLDVDYHHGNGTQAIFYDRSDVFVTNIHSDPINEYPYFMGHADETGIGAGEGYNLNLPLPKGTDWQTYEPALKTALDRIREFSASKLIVSFGADTYKEDPLGYFKLERENFTQIGKMIAGLGLPTATILEGGYAIDELGNNVVAMLRGLEGAQ
ncbi:histone deacetylase family protein [Kordiimonas sp. SCSIO 12610]|uniref:histone deacetylase family protein n=1 Tax=Kordiimonas sp. SCSIO 12610 TaxID=2829597 RepID=UPI0021096EC4|nr:histone deacetylase family protein [Kordiimonas sp. SCSIO 12610]UTW55944.1 histone deacetylase family protein [Kordiimonas sp. SCSIO 12610]